ncbi:hypothetical protein O1611_g474 [Lasiodiplodia mahajangana]|uniref:Uncharacterized protein n=1 Tax=Lasiodiplodia mahajangana TaxID=1108764 RepID=A0ACC2K113_9PEZI|nr:hypothetical protein O1611_g474 [Lasiodiplodia mahajangana]
MDPLTAIGLAGNVIQFVQFTSDLTRTAVEICKSPTGCAADILTLDSLYQQLNNFNDRLASGHSSTMSAQLGGRSCASALDIPSFRELSLLCKSDCEKLLSVVGTLKGKGGPGKRWQSFRTALRMVWRKEEIEELEKRLNRTQTTMTLHICTFASQAQESRARRLEELQRESKRLQLNQSTKLDRIITALESLGTLIAALRNQKPEPSATSKELEALEQEISKLSLSQQDVAEEQTILKSLSFETRPIRHASIPDAYQKTFQWAYDSKRNNPTSATSLAQWLKRGGGVFWVSGKPGSGKSTFMKFIADEPRTFGLLSEWSGSKKLVVASHYFWSAGTTMQKSQEGLLRSLLYEIFLQCPESISVCGNWRPRSSQGREGGFSPWTSSELYKILRKVATYETASIRICFFMDGLDEYDGNHDDLCKVLTDVAKSTNIKICLSSRPWNEFEQAFGDDPRRKLYMQDLTRNDILEYTRSRLYEHPRWSSLATKPSQGDWLVHEIEKRACGVFLWVFLVTNLLRGGLTNRDSFSDIRRRLESFPVELEDFFRQILESVDPFYHKKMSTMLQMAIRANEPLHAMAYDFHDQDYDDEDYVFRLPVTPYDPDEDQDLKEQMIWWLNSRSRGLLELNRDTGTVTFLHRTVGDFLKTRETSDFLAQKMPSGFNLSLCLLKVYTAMIKRSHFDVPLQRKEFGIYTNCSLQSFTANALAHAAEIGDSHPYKEVAHRIIEELERIIPMKYCLAHPRAFVREQLITGEHMAYLTWKLPRDPYYLSVCGASIILHILAPNSQKAATQLYLTGPWRAQGIGLLRLALETQNLELTWAQMNEDPIRRWTPWTILIYHVTSWSRRTAKWIEDRFWSLLENNILSMLLRKGANIDHIVWSHTNRSYSTFTAYVNLAFEIPIDVEREALYLRVFRDFLSAGATLNSSTTMSLNSSLHRTLNPKAKIISTSESFFGRLKTMDTAELRACNTGLLAEVTDMLLSTINEPNAQYVEQVRVAVEAAFPTEICNRFRVRYPAISWTYGGRQGRRGADTERDRETVKRLRRHRNNLSKRRW